VDRNPGEGEHFAQYFLKNWTTAQRILVLQYNVAGNTLTDVVVLYSMYSYSFSRSRRGTNVSVSHYASYRKNVGETGAPYVPLHVGKLSSSLETVMKKRGNNFWYTPLLTYVAHLYRRSTTLKVQHEIFFLTFFAETETLWSQGPVTRDF
jgi:hypothetical protein